MLHIHSTPYHRILRSWCWVMKLSLFRTEPKFLTGRRPMYERSPLRCLPMAHSIPRVWAIYSGGCLLCCLLVTCRNFRKLYLKKNEEGEYIYLYEMSHMTCLKSPCSSSCKFIIDTFILLLNQNYMEKPKRDILYVSNQ